MAPSLSPIAVSLPGILILCIFCSLSSAGSSNKAFDVSAKCRHILTTATLTNEIRDNTTLRVLVPWKVGFEQFVKFQPDSCVIGGFSIEVFKQAVNRMQHPRPLLYKFVLHGSGDETPSYDGMLDMLVNQTVDAVVADLTITRERMERVAFTVPYLASTLVMVTPFRYGSAGTYWDFLKPFSTPLWITLLCCFAATGVALYLLEDQNPDFSITSKKRVEGNEGSIYGGSSTQGFTTHATNVVATDSSPPPSSAPSSHSLPVQALPIRVSDHASPSLSSHQGNPNTLLASDILALQRPGPPIYDEASHKRRFMNAYWFTSLCVFQAQQESVRTHLGRIVTVTWLFVMLIFNSSYTASLASLLSAQKRYPTIDGLQALLRDENISVGYQQGSFMNTYMDNINLQGHRLKNLTSERDYAQALQEGNLKPDGVGAVLDELPYIQILLQSQCGLTKSSTVDDHLPSFGGFGFAFQKGDPLIDEVSKMILQMAEDSTLQILQDGWKIGDDKKGRCDSDAEPSHLRLRSFGGLFSIVVSVYVICIIWRLTRKAIKSPEGACSPLIQALPCMQDGSTIGQARELSLSRHPSRVHDETQDETQGALLV